MPKYLSFGDKPFLIDKMREKQRKEIKALEFNRLEADELTNTKILFLDQNPMFGNRKILIWGLVA